MQFSRGTFSRALQVSFFVGFSGCSTLKEMTLPNLPFFSTGSVACDSSSRECLHNRAVRLRTLTSDASHAWVRQVEPVDGYAAGTRLFAYRIAKTKLRCADLAYGLVELQAAHAAYGKPVSGVSTAQAKRTSSLIVQVRSELGHEMRRRCKSRKGTARIPWIVRSDRSSTAFTQARAANNSASRSSLYCCYKHSGE